MVSWADPKLSLFCFFVLVYVCLNINMDFIGCVPPSMPMVNMIIKPFMTRLDAMRDRHEESFYYDKRQICEMLNEAYFLGRKHERQEWDQAAVPKHRAAAP